MINVVLRILYSTRKCRRCRKSACIILVPWYVFGEYQYRASALLTLYLLLFVVLEKTQQQYKKYISCMIGEGDPTVEGVLLVFSAGRLASGPL